MKCGSIGVGVCLVGFLASTQAQKPAVSAPPPAAGSPSVVYRCPGPPVLYTDALTPAEAHEKGCRVIEGTPITVVQSPRRRAGVATAGAASGDRASASRAGEGRVDPAAQHQRDGDARRILEDELRREEGKLAALKRDYNNGEPERRGEERNYQTYLDRVAAMKSAIARSEGDIAAIKRELGKLAP